MKLNTLIIGEDILCGYTIGLLNGNSLVRYQGYYQNSDSIKKSGMPNKVDLIILQSDNKLEEEALYLNDLEERPQIILITKRANIALKLFNLDITYCIDKAVTKDSLVKALEKAVEYKIAHDKYWKNQTIYNSKVIHWR